MEPIPETADLIGEFGKYYDGDLLDELKAQAAAVREIVPDLVGLSLGALEDGVAFTLVATDSDVALLDAIQYVVGGPCVEAPRAEQALVEHDSDALLDEHRWHDFARASSAKAVATTLTLPVLRDDGAVVGTVNLYAASGGAFGGLHRQIADIFGAWAPGAVTNADLSFRTRQTAEQAPGVLRAAMRVDMAVGAVMAAESVDADTARRLLHEAAQRAGVPAAQFADTLLEVYRTPGQD